MNSLIFNVGVILFCSLAVAQFCTLAFSTYAQFTASDAIFEVQIQNLKGLKYGYDAFIFLLAISTLLTTFYVVYKPYHKQVRIQ